MVAGAGNYVGTELLGLDDFYWAGKNAVQGNWGEAAKSLGAGLVEGGLTVGSVLAAVPTGGASLAGLAGKQAAKEGAEQVGKGIIKGLTREGIEAAAPTLTKNLMKTEAREAAARAVSKENAAMAARTAGSTLPFSGKVGKTIAPFVAATTMLSPNAAIVAKAVAPTAIEQTLAAGAKTAASKAAIKSVQEASETAAKTQLKTSVPETVAKTVTNETGGAVANVGAKKANELSATGLGVNLVKGDLSNFGMDTLTPASVQAPATVQDFEEVQNESAQNKGPSEPGTQKVKPQTQKTRPKVKPSYGSGTLEGEDLNVPYTY